MFLDHKELFREVSDRTGIPSDVVEKIVRSFWKELRGFLTYPLGYYKKGIKIRGRLHFMMRYNWIRKQLNIMEAQEKDEFFSEYRYKFLKKLEENIKYE